MLNTTLIFKDYYQLGKPKVVCLMLITAWVGMILASKQVFLWDKFLFATIGIAFAASAAAVINQLADRHIDAKMSRTALRPIASGRIRPWHAMIYAILLGALGIGILLTKVNFTTTWLTFATLIGYAVFYTFFLKRSTPQNIVIGGFAGATPPLLGWCAVTGSVDPFSLLLVLIIFTWTPPHFWALAIYRLDDYQSANIPMLPVTHGIPFTTLCIFLYTIILTIITLFPYIVGMHGNLFLIGASALNILFLTYTYRLWKKPTHQLAIKTFRFSIHYLALLFLFMLADHLLQMYFLSR